MFEVSWGELAVVVGLGLALIGRKDLPTAARTAGTQVGRVVGLLQGARARADQFAAQNELRQLQNELRSGLRELDAVKSELAVSMSGRGLMGRGLGSMVSGANKETNTMIASPPHVQALSSNDGALVGSPRPSHAISDTVENIAEAEGYNSAQMTGNDPSNFEYQTSKWPSNALPPENQTIGAVAEEEWEKQGIAFQSKAERGAGLTNFDHATSGSVLLANLLKQTLIFDQYDRVVRQQDEALQSKMDTIQSKLKARQAQTESSKDNT